MQRQKESVVPYQVQYIIDNLLNKRENINIRSNYKSRLLLIKEEIESALRQYDLEIDTEYNKKLFVRR